MLKIKVILFHMSHNNKYLLAKTYFCLQNTIPVDEISEGLY